MTSTTASRPEGVTRTAAGGVLLALAAGAWALTAARMAGMDAGPGTDLGALGWFAVSWLLMMAAMMLPSLVPAAVAVARAGERTVAAFVAGYLAVWTAAGLAAYSGFETVRGIGLGFLAWDRAGRYVVAGVLLAAAAYQLSAAKGRCLWRCRTPGVRGGGLRAGVRHGANCVGCCTGLMAALFALGVMSLTWMALVAALIAAERLTASRVRAAVYGVGATLAVLALWVGVAPGTVPGLTVPGPMAGM